MSGWRVGSRRRSTGSAAIEMAVLMPMFLALLTAAVVLGRTGTAVSAVEMAAYDGARTASLARSAGDAATLATGTVERSLASQGLSCVGGPAVAVDTSGFSRPVGTPASVTVAVTCWVTYGDVDLIGVPADRPLTASFTSPLDQYRIRR
jgi:Flp pilus assembly protein TadG